VSKVLARRGNTDFRVGEATVSRIQHHKKEPRVLRDIPIFEPNVITNIENSDGSSKIRKFFFDFAGEMLWPN